MMLGDVLAAARNSAGRFQSWLAACDPDLADQVTDRAAKEGIAPASFVRAAVADFAARANEEDWATLTSSLRKADDPGTTCLLAMVHWRLSAPDCGRHDASAQIQERMSR